jgi:hypothetical protein
MIRSTLTLLAALACFGAQAQETQTYKPFKNLDAGITVGTTGIGVELTSHLSPSWDVRAGFTMEPRIDVNMNFHVQVGDEQQTEKQRETKFNKMATALYDLTGYKVDNKVVMEGTPKMYNFKLLVDFKPFHNKRWHVTTGFFIGNKEIAYAENSKEDMTSLVALGMYNHLYDKATNLEPYYITGDGSYMYLPDDVSEKLANNGRMGLHVGTYKHDVYYTEDVVDNLTGDVIHKAGDLKAKAGDNYNMEPDENGMVWAKAKANMFKPYLGFGYMGTLDKHDPRWKIGFDAGALFWGGSPSLKTHDGTDLLHDVTNLKQGVNNYVKIFKLAKVMPVVELRITRTLCKKK